MSPDLLALATIRRLALELRLETEVGELEAWMRRPLDGLGGMTPARALQAAGGEDQVKQVLAHLEGMRPPPER